MIDRYIVTSQMYGICDNKNVESKTRSVVEYVINKIMSTKLTVQR